MERSDLSGGSGWNGRVQVSPGVLKLSSRLRLHFLCLKKQKFRSQSAYRTSIKVFGKWLMFLIILFITFPSNVYSNCLKNMGILPTFGKTLITNTCQQRKAAAY